jgi:hypothetical protein
MKASPADAKAWLQDRFQPVILVSATPAVEATCQSKNGLSIVDILRPFGAMQQLNGMHRANLVSATWLILLVVHSSSPAHRGHLPSGPGPQAEVPRFQLSRTAEARGASAPAPCYESPGASVHPHPTPAWHLDHNGARPHLCGMPALRPWAAPHECAAPAVALAEACVEVV